MSKTPHPYADILRAIADGETVQYRSMVDNEWMNLSLTGAISLGGDPRNYRIKPRTIRIGDVDVPEPMREAPAQGAPYWVANPISETWVGNPIWSNDFSDKRWLERGLCYSNRTDAEAAGRAIAALFATEGAKQ